MSRNMYEDNKVSTATAVTVIDAAARAHVPVILWSDPGTGKTSLIRSMAEADAVPMEVLIGSQKEPQEVGGWPLEKPNPNGPSAIVAGLPEWAPALINAGGGYLFLDELSTAAPAVRAAMLTIIQDRVVGRTKLPDAVRIIAAANPPDHSAGGMELDPATANRFLHLDFAPTTEEWLTGMRIGFTANPASRAIAADATRYADELGMVIAYIEAQPQVLHVFPGSDTSSGYHSDAMGRPWPSNRSWHSVARVLAHIRADDSEAVRAVVFGLVGPDTGMGFIQWRAAMDLPPVADVLDNPKGIAWKDYRTDQVWAILSAAVSWSTGQSNKTAWSRAWGPIVAAAEAGVPGVAGAAARSLTMAMPPGAVVPPSVRKLKELAVAAGIAGDTEQVEEASKAKSLAGESVA